ncbi:MAG: AraC family transcriptional regulator [Reichenbachiella sp.]
MLLLVTIVIVLLDMFESQIRSLIIFEFELLIEPIVQVGILILVNIITYQGLKNPLFFQQITQNDLSVVNINKPHSSSALNKESLELLTIQLEAFMNLHKPYLNPDLDLNMLAEELESHPKKLSQAINQCIGNNFSDYINSRRIAEAKSLFETSTDSQITIMEVMYKVGFNSRSVFNTSFKKKIGFTPTQFKEQQFS